MPVVPSCSKCGGPLDGATGDVCPKCLLSLGVGSELEKPLEPGSMFHGLEVIQILGRGGMGVVYKARQPQLDRFVALKVLPRAMGQDPEFAGRFMREARALATLQHPNIVGVHDFGKEGDQHFFVMEYVDGTNLRAIMREGKLAPEEALKIVPLVCEALAFAHTEGVVHRDIKPENILLDKKGRVKVADFGLAKMLGGERTMIQNMTQSNVVMGTPHYMAPEQLENAKAVDHRADIYSLGVMLYEMLTGELPIGKFDPPSKRVQVDVRLDEIVLRTLEKSPEKRYQSMAEMGEEISRVSEKRGAKSGGGGGIPWKAAGLVAALLLIGFVIFLVATRPPTLPPTGELVKAALVEADTALVAAVAASPKLAAQDLEWTGEPPKELLKTVARAPFDEKDGTGVAFLDGAVKGRIEFRAQKTEQGWKVVEVTLAKSGLKLTWNGTTWTKTEPIPKDPWVTATASKEDLPPGWTIEGDVVEEETRDGVNRILSRSGLHEIPGCQKARQYELHGLGKKVHLWFYLFQDEAALDKALKHLRAKMLAWNRFLLDKGNILVWVIPDGSDGRLGVGVNQLEDRLRVKLGLEPAKRPDPTALKSDDLPAGWAVITPAKTHTPEEIAVLLKDLPLPDVNEIRDGWTATVGKAGTDQVVQITSVRTFESEPVGEALPAMRAIDPPAGKEMKILVSGQRFAVLVYGTRDPSKQAPYDELSKKIADRLGYSADDLQPRAKGVEATFDDQGMTLVFDVEGVSARDLSRAGSWDVQLWTRYNVGFTLAKMKPPEMAKSGRSLRGSIRVPMSGDLRLMLDVVPSWISVRVAWTTAKDARQFDISFSDLEAKLPAAYAKAFGNTFLDERDVPKGWNWGRDWEGYNTPFVATDDKERAWMVAFFDDIGKQDPAALRMGYAASIVPPGKPEGFEGAIVLLYEFNDEETPAKLAEKVKGAKNLARSDKQWVEAAGRRLMLVMLYGSNADAERGLAKVAASLKTRLNP